jgi:protein associated with RNAse G/E
VRKIQVISRKYDGALRDEYAAYLVSESPEALVVYAPVGTMGFDHRKGAWSQAPDGVLELYFKAKWYAVWHICEQNSFQNLIYAHIAMPAVLTGDTLAWVDLDLDYRVHLDESIELLDEDEFAQNSQILGYPPHVMTAVSAACHEVEQLYQQRAYPFNHREQVALYQSIKQDYGAQVMGGG